MRKHEALDVVQLYSQSNEKEILDIVRYKVQSKNMQWFTKTRYQLQAGMTDAANKNMNTDKIVKFYLWFLRLLEKGEKRILTSVHKNNTDKKRLVEKELQIYIKKESF